MLLCSTSVPKNCDCPSKTQQLEMEWGKGLVHFGGVTQAESLLLFPFHSVLSGKAEAAPGRSSLLFSFVFSPEDVVSGRSPEAAFSNLKTASRQIQQNPIYLGQHHSTGLPVIKNKNLKILRLGEMAVFDSSLISNYESL